MPHPWAVLESSFEVWLLDGRLYLSRWSGRKGNDQGSPSGHFHGRIPRDVEGTKPHRREGKSGERQQLTPSALIRLLQFRLQWPRTSFVEDSFPRTGVTGWCGSDSSTLHLLCTLFLLVLHQLHVRPLSFGSQRWDLCILRSASEWGKERRLGAGQGEENAGEKTTTPEQPSNLPSGETAQKTCPFTIPGWLLKRQKPKTRSTPAGRFS